MRAARHAKAGIIVATGLLLPVVAWAATTTASMSVSATVIASCSIAPRVMASPRAALSAAPDMCRAAATGGIPARRPHITTEHDAALNVTRIVFSF